MPNPELREATEELDRCQLVYDALREKYVKSIDFSNLILKEVDRARELRDRAHIAHMAVMKRGGT